MGWFTDPPPCPGCRNCTGRKSQGGCAVVLIALAVVASALSGVVSNLPMKRAR